MGTAVGEWKQVRWTEARQIVALTGQHEDRWPAGGIDPQTHYRAVRADGRRDEAIAFLGHALPRFEAIAWASRIIEDEAVGRALRPGDRYALDCALRWLDDPDDDRRRSAMDAAEEADIGAPERMLALAVYLSGGSISQPDLPPVLPPPETAGRLAAAAITSAAYRAEDTAGLLDRALDLGEKVAETGTRALDRP